MYVIDESKISLNEFDIRQGSIC